MPTQEVTTTQENANNKVLFWGCFIALITTAFGFVGRLFLIDAWGVEFDLDPAQKGRLMGIGIWPFALSIILFSLLIDRIGYKIAMFIAFMGHIIWVILGVSAYFVSQSGDKELAYQMIYWGSLILALGNGTVEAFINPVVATMFSENKTKWLNILHAGWPAGLVITGLIVIGMGDIAWFWKIGLIAIPAMVYGIVLTPLQFPVNERVASGVSYKEMLQEFGALGALVVGTLLTLQLMDFFKPAEGSFQVYLFIGIGVAMVAAFAIYTRSIGRPLLFLLILIMMPLATTEIGTDGWIESILKSIAKDNHFHSGWVLVYTSAIMMVLRFFAGPIVHKLSPLGLLLISSVLAIFGLYALSFTAGLMIFAAATLYALGKTFFWPTMLGVVSEQCPKGGALTLNAISGIGMLAVGTLGFPYIGKLQVDVENKAVIASTEVQKAIPGLVKDGKITILENKSIYKVIKYQAISEKKLKAILPPEAPQQKGKEKNDKGLTPIEKLKDVRDRSTQSALANMTIFPLMMLIGYLILVIYFKSKGGYKAEVLIGHEAEDAKFTGGVEGAIE
ncbi:hypothetical protein MNBD_PLANCTO02-2987 [hydrothermal vent metagenome]|uniref:Major facilitator superfamily (MFS) profile domain-containing protein n=1 Tax=hydrothermal vent metagenome TaxID=652676 RepID=A0A3B1DSV9_9ZZZZ